jgi:UrcA family protein
MLSRRGLYVLAAAGAVLAGAPALAQTVDELTVTGRLGPDGEPSSLSRAVSYADLDLTSPADRDVLKARIRDTARDLCDELGENNPSYTPIAPSCRTAAFNDAQPQMRQAFAEAPARRAYAMARADAEARARDRQEAAAAAETYTEPASAVVPAAPSYTVETVTNGPVPDTPQNRARYGGPISRAGMSTAPAGD